MNFINKRVSFSPSTMEKKWALPLFLISFILVFLLTSLNMGLLSSISTVNSFLSILPSDDRPALIIEPKLSPARPPALATSNIPRLAYLISGSKGDLDQLWRTLHALYHPRNYYVVHIDLKSSARERMELAARIANHSLFAKVDNVHVIKKANMVTYRGPTMVANTLHACAILLKKKKKWDWFINLSASDYPLVTQDDLLFTFSKLPRNLNFVEHTSRLGWKEEQRAKPLIIDPGLYMKSKSDVFWVSQRREVPNAYKLFTGSAWTILSRDFIEFCIHGYDNLPRLLLMYYANFISSSEFYFQTLICNSPQFATTVVNHDLHYISWDNPPKQHPRNLVITDLHKMISSRAPFARKFRMNETVLDRIDEEYLGRRRDGGGESFVKGGWCSGASPCMEVGDEGRLEPGAGSRRLAQLIDGLLRSDRFSSNQCK